MAAEIAVEGEVVRVTFESAESGFRVIKVAVEGRRDPVSIVGTFPRVAAGVRVRARGTIETDARFGDQLRAASLVEIAPSTLVGIEKYLGSGMVRGVGEKYAKRIVERFGMETLKVLDETPRRLLEIEGLGKKRADAIAGAWSEQRAVRDVMVFLEAHGASPALAARIFKRYGANAMNIVSRDPYRLAIDVWGIGFRTADRIASSMGIAKDSPERMQAGVLQALRDTIDAGHTYARVSDLEADAAQLLERDPDDARISEALVALTHERHVVDEYVQNTHIVAPSSMRASEARIAERLVDLREARPHPAGDAENVVNHAGSAIELPGAEEAIAKFEESAHVTLAPEQRDAVMDAARAPVVVITGGPGVGKTTIVRAILFLFERAGLTVRLAAPTGRAAQRMAEATGRPASTLHRLLEFEPKTGTFKRNMESPLECDAVVVDETSMVDTPMADALLRAIPDGARLVLVGDVDQLASVGPGAVLRDVIESNAVPCARLTRIFRQKNESLIVTNAHRINAGEMPIVPEPGDTNADFFIIERKDPERALETILELVKNRIPNRFGLDPVRDIQVLTPMHKGAVGSQSLNHALQAILNPNGPSVVRAGMHFRAGDKVMQLRNDYDRNVWNGDVGIVSKIDPEEDAVHVRFDQGVLSSDAPREDVVYEASDLDELTLAYACTVHKSQGSEYPAVVVPLLTSHFVMLTRNLLYTAVTRGKRLVVLVCDPRAVSLATRRDTVDSASEGRNEERRTRLVARIREVSSQNQPKLRGIELDQPKERTH